MRDLVRTVVKRGKVVESCVKHREYAGSGGVLIGFMVVCNKLECCKNWEEIGAI